MIKKMYLHFFQILLKVLDLFECRRDDPYMTANMFASLTRNYFMCYFDVGSCCLNWKYQWYIFMFSTCQYWSTLTIYKALQVLSWCCQLLPKYSPVNVFCAALYDRMVDSSAYWLNMTTSIVMFTVFKKNYWRFNECMNRIASMNRFDEQIIQHAWLSANHPDLL